jgi:hypothetical protein
MKDKLNSVETSFDPFEHKIIADFLPLEEYNKSLDHASYDREDLATAFAPLHDHFYNAFKNAKSDVIKSFNLQLTEWNQGYSYRPHLDGGPRVFSLVLFQPEHGNHPWLGTSLYKQVDNDFRLVTYAPYIPNTAVMFPCGFDHWHGNELQLEEHRRKALLCFFYDRKLDKGHGWDMIGYREYE